jgi:plastocyanin
VAGSLRPGQSLKGFFVRTHVFVVILAGFGLAAWGCGAGYSSGSNGNPAGPTPGAVTINIVAIDGAQSFSPNPATVPDGQMVVWHNVDMTTHRVVLDDRSVDTGNLAPGAFSSAMMIGSPGQYHCAIHPEMVGRIAR